MLRHALVVLTVLCASGGASAATWADGLFSELNHDFGALPRGAVGMHLFRVANTTTQPVHIASVRVSCGCVSASVARADLAPGEETVLVARIDSRRFAGVTHKSIYVLFDRPQYTEVRIDVQANSRDDLTITPDAVAFGQVPHGTKPERSVTISVIGHGKMDFNAATSDSAYIQPKLTPVQRDDAEVSYRLTTQLRPDLPAGTWHTTVWVTTSDPALPRLAVPVTVEVTEPRSQPVSRPAEVR